MAKPKATPTLKADSPADVETADFFDAETEAIWRDMEKCARELENSEKIVLNFEKSIEIEE